MVLLLVSRVTLTFFYIFSKVWLLHFYILILYFNTQDYMYKYIYTGRPKKVETRFNFLAIEENHAV